MEANFKIRSEHIKFFRRNSMCNSHFDPLKDRKALDFVQSYFADQCSWRAVHILWRRKSLL